MTSVTLRQGDSAVTLTIPGHRSGNPSGLYYLVGEHKYSCLDFTLEPEPAAEFISHPAVAWPQPLPGTSAAQAWPNLIGGRRYLASIGTKTPHTRWFTLGKLRGTGPATVRVVDSGGPGSSGCAVRLYNSASASARPVAAKVLNANQAVTFNVPARRAGRGGAIDQYYLSLGNGSGCGDMNQNGVSGYIIEPAPANAWGWNIHASITGISESAATGPLRTGANYAGTLTAKQGQLWAKSTATRPLTLLAASISREKSCEQTLTLRNSVGRIVRSFLLSEQVAKLGVAKGSYFLRAGRPAGCNPPGMTYRFLVELRSRRSPIKS